MVDLEWIAHVESTVENGGYSREQANIAFEEMGGGSSKPPEWVTPVQRIF